MVSGQVSRLNHSRRVQASMTEEQKEEQRRKARERQRAKRSKVTNAKR